MPSNKAQEPTHPPLDIPHLLASIIDIKMNTCLRRNDYLWSQNPELLQNLSSLCQPMLESIANETDGQNRVLFFNAMRWKPPKAHKDKSIFELVKNCSQFLEKVEFPTKPASKEENDYPLAYVFVAYRNAAQTVRLFRMLYQPQNVYCFTYDLKSSDNYIKALLAMTSCFPTNVYMNPNPEQIEYFGYSILHSVMSCMKVLAKSPIRWRYVQIVSWNDFPLKTNWELVQIFKILNGSQDCELINNDTPDYVAYEYGKISRARRRLPPGGITLYKGSFGTTMSREFVDFMFNDPISVRLYEYLNDSKCAEEYYWPSLIHNLHLNAPGNFPGQCEMWFRNAGEKKPFLSRFQVWDLETTLKVDKKCLGFYIMFSCVYGIQDLPTLIRRHEFIAHKVYDEFQPALNYCLEEWYWQRRCIGDTKLNLTYYENMPSVKYHRLSKNEKENYVCTL